MYSINVIHKGDTLKITSDDNINQRNCTMFVNEV